MILASLAMAAVAIWCVLLFARGGFWQIHHQFAPPNLVASGEPKVAIIIPARDEALHIAETVKSLIRQEFAGLWHIVVVDDNSTDSTSEIARTAANALDYGQMLTILQGGSLPPGWTGKLWALSQGITYASQYSPDYFLFTDADIVHGPNSLSELVGLAQLGAFDLVSFMVKLRCETLAERALIPAFVFFFFLLYPPEWICSESKRTAGAAGGCVLIRPQRLQQIGGIASISKEVIDDCALAKAVKQSGGRLWLGLTDERHSLRTYGTFAEVGRMISRTAFNQLHHSVFLLAGTLIGLLLVYLLPVALLFTGNPYLAAVGGLAWLLMSIAYFPMVRFYGVSPAWTFALPPVALFYSAYTLQSAIQYWLGRGGQWKGRAQDARRQRTSSP